MASVNSFVSPPQPSPMVDGVRKITPFWFAWFVPIVQFLNQLVPIYNNGLSKGLSVTITTAKLTSGGAEGSMTFVNGVLTAQTPAT